MEKDTFQEEYNSSQNSIVIWAVLSNENSTNKILNFYSFKLSFLLLFQFSAN